jgi:hypothetical protein
VPSDCGEPLPAHGHVEVSKVGDQVPDVEVQPTPQAHPAVRAVVFVSAVDRAEGDAGLEQSDGEVGVLAGRARVDLGECQARQ